MFKSLLFVTLGCFVSPSAFGGDKIGHTELASLLEKATSRSLELRAAEDILLSARNALKEIVAQTRLTQRQIVQNLRIQKEDTKLKLVACKREIQCVSQLTSFLQQASHAAEERIHALDSDLKWARHQSEHIARNTLAAVTAGALLRAAQRLETQGLIQVLSTEIIENHKVIEDCVNPAVRTNYPVGYLRTSRCSERVLDMKYLSLEDDDVVEVTPVVRSDILDLDEALRLILRPPSVLRRVLWGAQTDAGFQARDLERAIRYGVWLNYDNYNDVEGYFSTSAVSREEIVYGPAFVITDAPKRTPLH